jgi:hypothetical protein
VQVDAPFVFNAKDRAPSTIPPVPEVTNVPVAEAPERQMRLDTTVQAPLPAPPAKVEHPSFMHRLKGFFSSIFH